MQESGFDDHATSEAGATGLMQLTPDTGQGIADRTGGSEWTEADLLDPELNIRYGTWYLAHLHKTFGGDAKDPDWTLALAAYNAGQGKVRGWLENETDHELSPEDIPYEETRDYVRRAALAGQGGQELLALGAPQPPRQVGDQRVGAVRRRALRPRRGACRPPAPAALARCRVAVAVPITSDSSGESTMTTVPPVARRRSRPPSSSRNRAGRTAASRPRIRRRCRRPGAGPDLRTPPPTTRSATRSPRARSARPARTRRASSRRGCWPRRRRRPTARSRPARRPREGRRCPPRPAGRSTCSSPLRSETRQLIRRSRSPAWNGRMPANSVPSPVRRDRLAPTRPSGCGASAALIERRRRRQHAQLRAVLEHRPPAVPGPRARQRDPLLAEGPPPPAPRADLQHGYAVAHQPADAAGRRVQGDVRRLRADAGHVLDTVGRGHVQPRPSALALVERHVVERRPDDRRAAWAGAPSRGPPARPGRGEHHQHGLAEQHGSPRPAGRRPAAPG